MIVLSSTGTSICILELIANASAATPTYLFEVTKVGDTVSKSFIAADVSDAVCRNQRFDITVSTTENLLNGVVNLTFGEYNYTVYEVATVSLTAPRIRTLQTGIVIVEGPIINSIYI